MIEKTVYRVQDSDGRGPWRPGFSHLWVIDRPDHDNLLPWWVEMGWVQFKLIPGETGGTACMAIHQLKRWFTEEEYKKLLLLGFYAVSMNVDRILGESGTQCVFARKKPLNEDVQKIELYRGLSQPTIKRSTSK